jgi:maleate isomerase
MEPEFYAMAPNNVTIHSARMMLRDVTPDCLESMVEKAVEALKLLNTACIDVVIYGCTSGSLIKGVEWEGGLIHRLQKVTCVPVVSTAGAVVEALKVLKVTNVSVVTPYIDKINQLEKMFLEAYGINVTDIKGLGLIDNLRIGRITTSEILEQIQVASNTDCLFISCTNLPVIYLIKDLELKYGIPVVTSNQASLWKALQILGREGIENYGILLSDHLSLINSL